MKKAKHMNKYCIALAAVLVTPASAQVVEPEAPDFERWNCRKCLSYDGWIGSVDFGAIGVSEQSAEFGRYNGLANNGAYLLLDADLAYYTEAGQVWQVRAWDLGTDQRRMLLDGGTQGSYRFRLEYEESTIWGPEDAQSPYRRSGSLRVNRGSGSERLTLPSAWVRAGSTAGLSALDASLQPLKLVEDRDSVAVGVAMVASQNVEYSLDFRREYRDGLRAMAGGIGFSNAVRFAAPVDSVTDTLTASLSYKGTDWAAHLTYLGSFYDNEAISVEWENPFALGLGVDSGETALSPDNTFHQISVAANYQLSQKAGLYGSLAIGQGIQNDAFLPYTTNAALATSALPRDNLGGRVDTVTAVARYTNRIATDWRIKAEFRVNDRYNKTSQASYDHVFTDAFIVSQSRVNLPYGYKDRDLGLEAEYRLARDARLAFGMDREARERTFQAVEETVETGAWAKGRYTLGSATQLRLKLARLERDATAADTPPPINPAENPLLSKYNTADRRRDEARAHLGTQLSERVGLGFDLGYAMDDYTETELGLTEATVQDRGVDLNFLMADHWTLYGAYSLQEIDSTQFGNSGGNLNWRLEEEDRVETVSFGLTYAPPRTSARFNADIAHSISNGRVVVNNAGTDSAFPQLRMAFEQLRLSGIYPWSPALDVTAGLTYELGNADDWALDGVDPDTINSVLALGSDSIDYKVWVAYVGLRFKLDAPAD